MKVTRTRSGSDTELVPCLGPFEVQDGDDRYLAFAFSRGDTPVWYSLGAYEHPSPERFGRVVEAIERCLVQKEKRSVVVSRETMRPMSEAPKDGVVLSCQSHCPGHTYLQFVDCDGSGDWRERDERMVINNLIGWWPLPDLTPMPAEFDGWEV